MFTVPLFTYFMSLLAAYTGRERDSNLFFSSDNEVPRIKPLQTIKDFLTKIIYAILWNQNGSKML